VESDRLGFGLPRQEFDEAGAHTAAYWRKIREIIRMAKFTAQGVQILLNADGKVAQVSVQGMVALQKSQANMGFVWSPDAADMATLQGVVDKGLEQIRAEEGLDPGK
jgi:hypothetical protein